MDPDYHKRIVIGVEIEAYAIDLVNHRICRKLSRPRRGLSESGERFTRDTTIGSEYNSRPFQTVRESLFLLRSGLRKYIRRLYRSRRDSNGHPVPLLVGGWTNRVAGAHLHVSTSDRLMDQRAATSLSFHIHDHLPLLVAICANSPIWDRRITSTASNRVLHGSDTYFSPLRRGRLETNTNREMCFVPGRKTKPPTLEIRILDSNLPQYLVAGLTLVKAISLRWLRRKPASNRISYEEYLASRMQAARYGMSAWLNWRGERLRARDYLDRFLWVHRAELEDMDVPEEIYDVMRWVKRGFNGARLIRDAAQEARRKNPLAWQKHFAQNYVNGLEELLSGNTLAQFAKALKIDGPDVSRTRLGHRRSRSHV